MQKVMGIIILMFGVSTLSIDLVLGVMLRDFTVLLGSNLRLTELFTGFPYNIAIVIPIVSAVVGVLMCLSGKKNMEDN